MWCSHVRQETAGLSTALRFGRDDSGGDLVGLGLFDEAHVVEGGGVDGVVALDGAEGDEGLHVVGDGLWSDEAVA